MTPQTAIGGPSSSTNNLTLVSTLDEKLALLLKDIQLTSLSRIDETRLAQKALPHIGFIELVSADNFTKFYDDMYISMFPISAERERSDLIVDRLRKEFAGKREDLAPYRIVGIRAHDGTAIGAAHFSILMLKDEKHVVPYLQYIYVRPENRRQDMAEVLHTMILAVATAYGIHIGNRTVPFTLFETEPAGHGKDDTARQISTQRIKIHSKAGAIGLMLKNRKMEDILISPHCQPGLEVGEPPISLIWAIRNSPAMKISPDVKILGPLLVAAYYQSMRDEGFPNGNIQLAERIVRRRSLSFEYTTVPLDEAVAKPIVEFDLKQ